MGRQHISSGAPWEDQFGYARAVRVGDQVHVSGTTATRDGAVVGEDDPHRQAEIAIEIIESALEEAGAGLEHVVRTRLYLTDVAHSEAVGHAHEAAFGDSPPAATMVGVDELVDPAMLVEIEATAVIDR